MVVKERSGVMLIQFRCKNHKCFYEEAVLDMTATAEQRHSDFLIEKNGNKLLPVVTIHGANAAGKTTIIDAFYSMSYLVVKSFDLDNEKPLRIFPFIFNEKYAKENSKFEVFINIDDKEYRYGFIANKDKIEEEWLYSKPFNIKTRAKEKMLFERVMNKVNAGKNFNVAKENEDFLTDKTLLLSVLGRRKVSLVNNIYRWFYNMIYIKEIKEIKENIMMPKYIIRLLDESESLKKAVEEFMKEVDPCLGEFVITKEKKPNQEEEYELCCSHYDAENPEKKYIFPIDQESAGTYKAVTLIPIIIQTLATGGTLFVDELDIKFHPLLYRKVVAMFNNKDLNIKHAQLIYSTHSTYLLNSKELRRDQIYLVNKNKKGLSQLYSLSEFSKLRIDTDYEKKYLSGEFGAIPFQ